MSFPMAWTWRAEVPFLVGANLWCSRSRKWSAQWLRALCCAERSVFRGRTMRVAWNCQTARDASKAILQTAQVFSKTVKHRSAGSADIDLGALCRHWLWVLTPVLLHVTKPSAGLPEVAATWRSAASHASHPPAYLSS